MTRAQPPNPSSPSGPKPSHLVRGPEWGKLRIVEYIAPFRIGDPCGNSLGDVVTRYGWDEDELGDSDPEEIPELAKEFLHKSCEICSDARHQDLRIKQMLVAAGKMAALCEAFIFYGQRLGLSVNGLFDFLGLLDQWVQLWGRAVVADDLYAARGSANREVEAIRVQTSALVQEQGGTVSTEGQARGPVMSPPGDSEVDETTNENGGPSARRPERKSAPAEDQLECAVRKIAKQPKWRKDLAALWRVEATNEASSVKAGMLASEVGSKTGATQKRLRRERSAGLVRGGRGGWWMSRIGIDALRELLKAE